MTFVGNLDGHSITHPPMFNRIDYTYSKTRMRIFLISIDFELWNIIEKYYLPMNDWNELEKKTITLNAKIMNALFCALDKNEFNRVSICETTFDI